MRKRKRISTHDVTVMKFKVIHKDLLLPEPLYRTAKAMDEAWSDIARYCQAVWDDFRNTNAFPAKPGNDFYAGQVQYAFQRVASLPDELGPALIERLLACFRRLKQGGGPPKPKTHLNKFCLHHRFTRGGLAVEKLGGERAERFRIKLPADSAYAAQGGSKNPRALRYQRLAPFWFRVDKEVLRFNAVIHRRLPQNGIVKRVALTGRKQSVATGWELSLVFTLEVPKVSPSSVMPRGPCGIDVGWRKLDDERMRVAVLYDGVQHEELVLPLTWHDPRLGEIGLKRLANISRQRDLLLERIKATLQRVGMKQHPQARNGALMQLLRDPSTPESVIALLETWRRDNDHYLRLARWVENRMRRHYEHVYQNWAKSVAQRYSLVRIEKMNLGEMWKGGERNYGLGMAAERRKLAAVGRLLRLISLAVSKAGGRLEEQEAAHTTDICSDHGTAFYAQGERLGYCEKMHQKDQDWNAAENLFYACSGPGHAERGDCENVTQLGGKKSPLF